MPHRCCGFGSLNEKENYDPCYASVLVSSGSAIEGIIKEMESRNGTIPCITSWCNKCKHVSFVVTGIGGFPCHSAYYAHCVVLASLIAYSHY